MLISAKFILVKNGKRKDDVLNNYSPMYDCEYSDSGVYGIAYRKSTKYTPREFRDSLKTNLSEFFDLYESMDDYVIIDTEIEESNGVYTGYVTSDGSKYHGHTIDAVLIFEKLGPYTEEGCRYSLMVSKRPIPIITSTMSSVYVPITESLDRMEKLYGTNSLHH